jgi:serine/threonine protein kinase
VATETNSPVVLRTVKHEPAVSPKPLPQNGIAFECPTQTRCANCKAVVPLVDVKPLTTLPCPSCGAKVFVPGRVGGFLLYAHIGEGEMGAIYRATDESLFRDVAIKLVRGCHADDPEQRERLRREACAAGRVNHPRVAQVHALNFSNGHPYLVMELVNGQDFAQKLDKEGPIGERAVLKMALEAADGLSALNREGLVHGDIKPGNIVLDRDGNAKLVDFGLSGMTRCDSNGNFVGTPDYIAPELLRGAPDSHRSDIYSLGATLYHLLSGRPPFEGKTSVDVLKARLLHAPTPLGKIAKQVSVPTQKLVMSMLESSPARRPADCEAVASEIRNALANLDSPQPARHPGISLGHRLTERFKIQRLPTVPAPADAAPPSPSRRRRWLAVLLLSAIALAALTVALQQDSFRQTYVLLRHEWVNRRLALAAAASRQKEDRARSPAQARAHEQASPQPAPELRPPPAPAETHALRPLSLAPAITLLPASVALTRDAFFSEARLLWQSVNLGTEKTSGSTITLKMGETIVIQGAGTGMWKGSDRCRFVWTQVAGDYALSAQIKAVADNHPFAISGLLAKGEEPAAGPGLLFGFLGSGELFLQRRQPGQTPEILCRSEGPVPLPCHLKLIRRGNTFEACVSTDGLAWKTFASCALDLPAANAVGFAVSAEDAAALAPAKLAHIRLLTPSAPKTNAPPAAAKRPPARAR